MPIYVCEYCDYETTHRGTMERHLKRDKPCPMQRIMVNLEIMELIKEKGLEIIRSEEAADTS